MDKYQTTFKTWNKIASLYEEKFMDLDIYDRSYDEFCAHVLRKNSTILEVGCGPGNITKYILTKRPDFKLLGVDIAPNMIELAKKNNPSASFSVMDCRQLDDLEGNYDAIMCGFCLPYLSKTDCSKFIHDCGNLLVDDGVFYFSFVEGDYDKSGYQKGSTGDKSYFHYHRLEYLTKELKANNFVVSKILNESFEKSDESIEIHSIIIARKANVKFLSE